MAKTAITKEELRRRIAANEPIKDSDLESHPDVVADVLKGRNWFHGTVLEPGQRMDSFGKEWLGRATDARSAEHGVFLTSNKDTAGSYTESSRSGEESGLTHEYRRVLGVSPEITKTKYLNAKGRMVEELFPDGGEDSAFAAWLAKAKADGYDSAVIKNVIDGGPKSDVLVVFDPAKAKIVDQGITPPKPSLMDRLKKKSAEARASAVIPDGQQVAADLAGGKRVPVIEVPKPENPVAESETKQRQFIREKHGEGLSFQEIVDHPDYPGKGKKKQGAQEIAAKMGLSEETRGEALENEKLARLEAFLNKTADVEGNVAEKAVISSQFDVEGEQKTGGKSGSKSTIDLLDTASIRALERGDDATVLRLAAMMAKLERNPHLLDADAELLDAVSQESAALKRRGHGTKAIREAVEQSIRSADQTVGKVPQDSPAGQRLHEAEGAVPANRAAGRTPPAGRRPPGTPPRCRRAALGSGSWSSSPRR